MVPVAPLVRPRISWGGHSAPAPIDRALAELMPRRPGDVLAIIGGPGSGKTTVLEYIRDLVPPGVMLLDEPDIRELWEISEMAPVIAAMRGEPDQALQRVYLAPWDDDDLIEYGLRLQPQQRCSVLSRVMAMPDRDQLGGNPAIWIAVLTLLGVDEQLHSLGEVLRRLAERALNRIQLPPRDQQALIERAFAGVAEWTSEPAEETAPERALLAHGPLAATAAAILLGNRLRRKASAMPTGLVAPQFTRAFGPIVREDQQLQDVLRRVLRSKRQCASHSAAATILHAAAVLWRPTGRRSPLLHGASLAAICWPEINVKGLSARGADLSRAILHGAKLPKADLERAKLTEADLSQADLSQAVLDDAHLVKADLSEATLRDASLYGADLDGAKLDRAQLRSAQLSFATLDRASLRGGRLRNARLLRATVDEADLTGARFLAAELRHVDLRTARLERTRFRKTRLIHCDLSGTHLAAADFRDSECTDVNFTGSIMPEAYFRGATLARCGLADVHWEGADLRGADLQGSTFHMGSSRSGLLFTGVPCEGSRTGFYTDDLADWTHKAPEEIRKANLRSADLRGAIVEGVDFYLVDLRDASYESDQEAWFRACGAILHDATV